MAAEGDDGRDVLTNYSRFLDRLDSSYVRNVCSSVQPRASSGFTQDTGPHETNYDSLLAFHKREGALHQDGGRGWSSRTAPAVRYSSSAVQQTTGPSPRASG